MKPFIQTDFHDFLSFHEKSFCIITQI